MIHPDTVVKMVSPVIGNGVFATAQIKRGTIVVVRDKFDIILSMTEFSALPVLMQQEMEKYMYCDKHGNFVLSWDHARYMNHSCASNTMMTDYGFEIAVRDISAGEEITSEYGLLNVLEPYGLDCGCTNCRGQLRCDDLERYGDVWDLSVRESIQLALKVEQPLLEFLSQEQLDRIKQISIDHSCYSSVKNLQYINNIADAAE